MKDGRNKERKEKGMEGSAGNCRILTIFVRRQAFSAIRRQKIVHSPRTCLLRPTAVNADMSTCQKQANSRSSSFAEAFFVHTIPTLRIQFWQFWQSWQSLLTHCC